MELFLNVANVYLKIMAQMLIFKQISELPIKRKWFFHTSSLVGLFIVRHHRFLFWLYYVYYFIIAFI